MGAPLSRRTYSDIYEVPDDVEWQSEDFYDDECQMATDLLGGPDTLLNGWWTYESCVETTGIPYLLQLEDGGVMKLAIEAYF